MTPTVSWKIQRNRWIIAPTLIEEIHSANCKKSCCDCCTQVMIAINIIYEEFFLVSLSCFSKSDSYFPIILYFFTFRNSCLIFLRENVRRLKATRWQIGARLNCDPFFRGWNHQTHDGRVQTMIIKFEIRETRLAG